MSENRLHRAVPVVVNALSTAAAIVCAAGLILLWGLTGPVLHFSSAWQLSINTTTTIITFLVGFCILYTTKKESKATQVKLDALIEGVQGASNKIVGLEDEAEEVIDQAKTEIREAVED